MDNNYSYIQDKLLKKEKRISIVRTLLLFLILLFLFLMFMFTFYVRPYLNLVDKNNEITLKKHNILSLMDHEEINFVKKSYSYFKDNKYYIYNDEIELKFEKEKYNELQLQTVLKYYKIEPIKIAVGIAFDKPAIFIKNSHNITWILNYDTFALLYNGELK